MKILPLIVLLLVAVIQLGRCRVTDKDYARLPPIFRLDNFDRCLLLEGEALYCVIDFHLQPIDTKNPSESWKQIQELNVNIRNYHHDNLRHGLCVPLNCPNISSWYKDPGFKNELATCYSRKFKKLGLFGTIDYLHCQTKEAPTFDFYDYTVTIFLIVLVTFVLYSSFYEGLARYKTPKEYNEITKTTYGKLVSCFSIPKNWYRLTTVNRTPDVESLKSIQGIRFFNFITITVAHSCLLALVGPVSNSKWAEDSLEDPLAIFMASGPFAVQTFFLISAWLLTYNIFLHFNEKSDKKLDLKTIAWIILNRYIRLTPSLAIVIMIHGSLMNHAGRGPWWDRIIGRERNNCRQNSWTNLLYVNNIINPSKMCFIETWYMAVDMHGFILVLGILYFVVKKPNRIKWVVPAVWVMCQAKFLTRVYQRKMYTFMMPYAEQIYNFNAIYLEDGSWINTLGGTASNMSGTLVGMVAGYIYYKTRNEPFHATKIHIVLWWCLSFGMALSIIIFPGIWVFSNHYYDTWWFSLPYYAFGATIFATAISIGILGFTKGIGWMAKWTVEARPMYVLGRLSYSAFLMHYMYSFIQVASKKDLSYASDYNVVINSIEIVTCSLILGLALALMVELPVSALQSTFLNKGSEIDDPKIVENGGLTIENEGKQKRL